MSDRDKMNETDVAKSTVDDEKTPTSVGAGGKQAPIAHASNDQTPVTASKESSGLSNASTHGNATVGASGHSFDATAVAKHESKLTTELKTSMDAVKTFGGPFATSTIPLKDKIGPGLVRSPGFSNLNADQDAASKFNVRDVSFGESAASSFDEHTAATFGVSTFGNPTEHTTRNPSFDSNAFMSSSAPQDIKPAPKSNFFGNFSYPFAGQQNAAKTVAPAPAPFNFAMPPSQLAKSVRIAESAAVE
jgi:hypothetical protein